MPRLASPVTALVTPVVVAATLGLVAACKPPGATPPSGDVAAALALPTLDGATFDPATLRGKPAIVMFWRTGCSYCMKEMPIIQDVAREHGATAVAVMVAGNRQSAKRLAADFDGAFLVDDGTLRKRYDIKAVPYTLVLRPDGTAARAFIGEQTASTLASAVKGAR